MPFRGWKEKIGREAPIIRLYGLNVPIALSWHSYQVNARTDWDGDSLALTRKWKGKVVTLTCRGNAT